MKPGDKVVCVDDSPCFTCGVKMTGLFKDRLYVISHFDPECRELVCMVGVEFECECGNDGAAIERFRKLDELKAEARLRQSQKQPAMIPTFPPCVAGMDCGNQAITKDINMKKIEKYKAGDGREFDDAKLCKEHERMIELVTAIMATLPPTPRNINEGWYQHDKSKVLSVKRALLKLAKPLFKGYPKIEAQIAENPDAIHPMSFVGRLLDDADSPINDGWRRLCCIDDKFREHNQPYFAINGPEKRHKQLN